MEKWYKVLIPLLDDKERQSLLTIIYNAYSESQSSDFFKNKEDVTIYMQKMTKDPLCFSEQYFYFSPYAALYMNKILSEIGATECDKPLKENVEIFHGTKDVI